MDDLKKLLLQNLMEQYNQLNTQLLQNKILDEPDRDLENEINAMLRVLDWTIGLVKNCYNVVQNQHKTEEEKVEEEKGPTEDSSGKEE